MQAAFALARAVHIAAALFVFGASAYRAALPPGLLRPAADNALRMALRVAAAVGLVTAALWFLFVAADMTGTVSAMTDPAALRLVLIQSAFGTLWLWRLGIGLALVAALMFERTGRRPVTLVLAAGFAASLALTGHAADGAGWPGAAHRIADALHLLCAGLWLGGLVVLFAILNDVAPPAARAALQRFSALAIPAVALVLVTGAANALFVLPDWAALWTSRYGVLLIVKIVLAAAMVLLALVNRFRLVPRLAQTGRSGVSLRSNIATELVLGVAVLGIVGFLGLAAPH